MATKWDKCGKFRASNGIMATRNINCSTGNISVEPRSPRSSVPGLCAYPTIADFIALLVDPSRLSVPVRDYLSALSSWN